MVAGAQTVAEHFKTRQFVVIFLFLLFVSRQRKSFSLGHDCVCVCVSKSRDPNFLSEPTRMSGQSGHVNALFRGARQVAAEEPLHAEPGGVLPGQLREVPEGAELHAGGGPLPAGAVHHPARSRGGCGAWGAWGVWGEVGLGLGLGLLIMRIFFRPSTCQLKQLTWGGSHSFSSLSRVLRDFEIPCCRLEVIHIVSPRTT